MIAWANDIGVKIYDTLAQRRIKYIERPKVRRREKPRSSEE